MNELTKSGFFNISYVLQIDGLDNPLGVAIMTIADFDRLAAQATDVSQDPDTGLISMSGEGFAIELNPESMGATITRIF